MFGQTIVMHTMPSLDSSASSLAESVYGPYQDADDESTSVLEDVRMEEQSRAKLKQYASEFMRPVSPILTYHVRTDDAFMAVGLAPHTRGSFMDESPSSMHGLDMRGFEDFTWQQNESVGIAASSSSSSEVIDARVGTASFTPTMFEGKTLPENPFLVGFGSRRKRITAASSALSASSVSSSATTTSRFLSDPLLAKLAPDSAGEFFRRGLSDFYGKGSSVWSDIAARYFPHVPRKICMSVFPDWAISFFEKFKVIESADGSTHHTRTREQIIATLRG